MVENKKEVKKSASAKTATTKDIKKSTKAVIAKSTKESAKAEKTIKKPTEKKNVVKKEENKKFAVIKTGGKQYKIREGQELLIEKIEIDDGKSIFFEEVLLVAEDKNVKVGTPKVAGAKVEAEVVSQEKGPKVVVFKTKPKKRYRKKTGHRQKLTKIRIKKISH